MCERDGVFFIEITLTSTVDIACLFCPFTSFPCMTQCTQSAGVVELVFVLYSLLAPGNGLGKDSEGNEQVGATQRGSSHSVRSKHEMTQICLHNYWTMAYSSYILPWPSQLELNEFQVKCKAYIRDKFPQATWAVSRSRWQTSEQSHRKMQIHRFCWAHLGNEWQWHKMSVVSMRHGPHNHELVELQQHVHQKVTLHYSTGFVLTEALAILLSQLWNTSVLEDYSSSEC